MAFLLKFGFGVYSCMTFGSSLTMFGHWGADKKGYEMKKLIAGAAFAAVMGMAGQASAGPNIVANPGFDLNSLPEQTAPVDWTLTPAASGSDFFVAGAIDYSGATYVSAPNAAISALSVRTMTRHDSSNSENDFSAWFGGTELLSLTNTNAFGWTLETFTAA